MQWDGCPQRIQCSQRGQWFTWERSVALLEERVYRLAMG